MREIRPHFLHTRQNNTIDGRLELEIRKQLALLQQRMRSTAQKFGSITRVLQDGRYLRIQVNLNGPVPAFVAKVSPALDPLGARAPQNCSVLSGVYSVDDYALGGPVQQDGTIPYFAFRHDAELSYSAFSASEQFNKHFETESFLQPWVPFPNSLVAKKSTAFSGEMRKVVQLLAGQNAEIHYDYHHYNTHGIFVNQKTQQRWVIEISFTNGINAWPLPACASQETDLSFAYLPLPGARYPNRTALAVSGNLSLMWGMAPLSNEIGWAFSYSGHEAQTIVLEAIPSHIPPGSETAYSDYYKAHRYKFSITSDVDGNPVGATLSDEESDWFWSRWLANNIRVPDFVSCGPAHRRIVTISGQAPLPPTDSDYEFPFFVYYNQDNEEQVYRYHHGAVTTTSIPSDTYPSTGLNSFGMSLLFESNGKYYSTTAQQRTWEVYLTGPFSFGNQPAKVQKFADRLVYQYEGASYPYAVNPIGGNSSPQYIALDCVLLIKDARTNSAEWDDYQFSFVIPFFEREGFYLYQRTHTWDTADTIRRNAVIVGKKRHSAANAAAWGYRTAEFACIPGGSGKRSATASSIQAATCSGGLGEPSPPETMTVEYQGITQGQAITNEIFNPTVQYCNTCDPFSGQYLVRTYKWYDFLGMVTLPWVKETDLVEDNDATLSTSALFTSNCIHGPEPVPYDQNVMNPGGLADNNDSCALATPWFLCAVGDTAGSGVQIINYKIAPSTNSDVQVIGQTNPDIDLTNLPRPLWVSGFFGTPFNASSR